QIAALTTPLSVGDRQAINLYLAGAGQAAADRNALPAEASLMLIQHVLERSGLDAAAVGAFFTDLENHAARPRYRRMIEAGAAAFAARSDGTPTQPVSQLLGIWNDMPAGGTAQQITFLLTDIVGSTALTSQIGNAGAQRVVRAHNAIARAATKTY